MTGNRTKSGNLKPLKKRVCLQCKTIYYSRKGNPKCPNCGRKHHTWKRIQGLLRDNKQYLKRVRTK